MNIKCLLGSHDVIRREISIKGYGFVKYRHCVKCGRDFCWSCSCKSIINGKYNCVCDCHEISNKMENEK